MILKLIRKIGHELSEGSFEKKEEKAGGREEGSKKRKKSSWILKRTTFYGFGTCPSIDRSMNQNPESRTNVKISPLTKVTFQESRGRTDYLKMMLMSPHMWQNCIELNAHTHEYKCQEIYTDAGYWCQYPGCDITVKFCKILALRKTG